MREAIVHGHVVKAAGVKAAESGVSGEPQGAVAGLQHGANKVVDQALGGGEVHGSFRADVVNTASIGTDPQRTIARAQNVAYMN